jgi:hypothetical protein
MVSEQKINNFIDLQLKANKAYQNYGEVPYFIVEQLSKASNKLTYEEIKDAFTIFTSLISENEEIIRAELN